MTDVWVALGSCSGLVGVLLSIWAFLRTRGESLTARHAREIARTVQDLSRPVDSRVTELEFTMKTVIARLDNVDAALSKLADRFGPILDRLAVIETKIDVYWRNVAMNAAQILHSPHPERAHVDALLEAFQAGTLDEKGHAELMGILKRVAEYEPGGEDLGFPIHPGEQFAAVAILSIEEARRAGERVKHRA